MTEVNTASFCENPGALLQQVRQGTESIVIREDGQPVAVLIDALLFERISRLRERFDYLTDRLAAGFAATPMDEGLAEIDAAVAAERQR